MRARASGLLRGAWAEYCTVLSAADLATYAALHKNNLNIQRHRCLTSNDFEECGWRNHCTSDETPISEPILGGRPMG